MVRPLLRTSLPICALFYVFVGCGSKDNDFFGSAAGTNQDAGSSGLSGAGGNTTPTSGTGGKSAGTGGSGLSTGGTDLTGGASAAGGTPGGAPAGGTGSGGTLSTSGTGGTDAMAGDGGENAAGMGAAGMSEDAGGAGGDGSASGGTGTGGSSGTAGSATGGTAGSATGGTAGSATGGTAGMPDCEASNDCDDNEYCRKETCDAAEGTCTQKPESCVGQDAVFDPVCGCDGMTYFTPCVAAREGVNAKSAGECTGNNRPTCNRQDGGASCEPHREGARCYRPRVGCQGTSDTMGVCWVLPDQCPENEPQTQTYCGGTTGDSECVGLCEILDEDMAVYRDSPACAPR